VRVPPALPLVCGALGKPSRRALRRLHKALGKQPKRVLDEDGVVLFLDRDPLRWSGNGTYGVAWAESLPVAPARPRTWGEAASEWGASGIVFDGGRWRLHTSVSGLAPLYYLTGSDATYFSSRIDALAAAAEEPLGVDWVGWAGIFTVGYPLGERTPFVEIRRLEPAACVEHSPTGSAVRSHDWPWAQVDPAVSDRDAGASAIVEALRERFALLPEGEPIHSLLSGGWDSRLLLTLARQRGDLPIRAWTVNNDVGHHEEERLAGIVTTELGVDHEIVPSVVGKFWEDWTETAARQDFQEPTRIRVLRLGRLLQEQPGIALEGIAGDIFIKGLYVTEEMLDAPAWETAVDMLWRRTFRLRRGVSLFDPGFYERMIEVARAEFDKEIRRFSDHPAGATLAIYWLRTRRSISAGPLELIGSHVPVAIPFSGDAVVRASLAVEPRQKLEGDLYKRVWEAVDPRVAALPSTNDPGYDPGPRTAPRIVMSKRSVSGYVEVLSGHPLRPLFSRELNGDVESGRIRPYLRHRQRQQTLDALCRFGLWHERYKDRLRPLDLKELGSPQGYTF
jgi:hypothetical protein